jgi:ankyrin repeat protein
MIAVLLKASLIIAILLAFYKLFLEKESFFAANRIYLVGGLILTFALPFASLPMLVNEQGFISTVIERINHHEDLSPAQQSVYPENRQSDFKAPLDTSEVWEAGMNDWFLRLYFFGVAIFSLNLLFQVVNVLMKARNSTDTVEDVDSVIINKRSVQEPCSFFRYIFINPGNYDYDTYEQIVAHEKIHVRKLHAADLLIAEMAIILLWFNPLAWLYRKEVEKNIEYETDALMLKGTTVEKEQYQMNLLKIATHNKPLTITTNYNQSLIKQRIYRMNSKKSSPHSYWKYAFMPPLILAMILLINKPVSGLAGSIGESTKTDKPEQFESREADNCQALLTAVKEKDIKKVKALLKSVGPDCTYRGDGEPRSPLVAAARVGDLEIGALLVDAGADVGFHASGDETPLMAAAAAGHLDFVKYLVVHDADINKKLGGDGCALLVAARQGRVEVVKYLISAGADVNAQVNGDGTPLICAVRNEHYETVKILLENGADPYQVSPGDEYAMYHARMSNNKAIIALLKKYDREN